MSQHGEKSGGEAETVAAGNETRTTRNVRYRSTLLGLAARMLQRRSTILAEAPFSSAEQCCQRQQLVITSTGF